MGAAVAMMRSAGDGDGLEHGSCANFAQNLAAIPFRRIEIKPPGRLFGRAKITPQPAPCECFAHKHTIVRIIIHHQNRAKLDWTHALEGQRPLIYALAGDSRPGCLKEQNHYVNKSLILDLSQ
jgi:hypothetical protein